MKENNKIDEEIIKLEDKDLFLDTLNKNGFLLEDRTEEVLGNLDTKDRRSLILGKDKVLQHPTPNDRVEIDFIFFQKNKHLIIECKKTVYAWFFPKAIEKLEIINLIQDSEKGIQVFTIHTKDFKVTWDDISLTFNNDGTLKKQRGGLAQTSGKEIHGHIRQSLKETEAYVCTKEGYLGARKSHFSALIIPVIVTNAKLYCLTYSKNDISKDGDLQNYEKVEEVGFIAYNFSEAMKWDNGGSQTILNKDGQETQDHTKTVFIVNINSLNEFIKLMAYYHPPLEEGSWLDPKFEE